MREEEIADFAITISVQEARCTVFAAQKVRSKDLAAIAREVDFKRMLAEVHGISTKFVTDSAVDIAVNTGQMHA